MDPRYPIGKFELPKEVTPALRQAAIDDLAGAPGESPGCGCRAQRRAT